MGAGQAPLGRVEAVAGAAGRELALAGILCRRGSGRQDREQQQGGEKSHARKFSRQDGLDHHEPIGAGFAAPCFARSAGHLPDIGA